MKTFLAAVAIVLVLGSTASAGWTYVAARPVVVAAPVAVPAAEVHYFYPVGPVYAYPGPVVRYHAPPPVVAYRPAVVPVPARVVYPPPVVVRPKVYVRGQPVRNVLRAITP